MKTTFSAISIVCVLIAAAAPVWPPVVYKDNFRDPPFYAKPAPRPNWSHDFKNDPPSPLGIPYKGLFSGATGANVHVELHKLPKHGAIVASFNLVTVGPWTEPGYGADFELHQRITAVAIPGLPPLLAANPRTNATKLGEGQKGRFGFPNGDIVYSISISFQHFAPDLWLEFRKGQSQTPTPTPGQTGSPAKELSFGIHEIEIAAFPDSNEADKYAQRRLETLQKELQSLKSATR